MLEFTAMRVDVGGGRLRVRSFVPTITVGLLLGVIEVVFATSLATLIFSGPAAHHLASGVGLTLFAAVATMTVIALLSGLPAMVGSVQDSTAPLFAVMAASIMRRLPEAAEKEFLTLVLVIALTTVLAGVFFFVLGRFRLGDLVRFVPYPVFGGFLAGAGWLLLVGGVSMLTRTSLSIPTLHTYGEAGALLAWVPGLLFAVALLLLVRRVEHFLVLPGTVVAGVALFYLVLAVTGTPIVEAKERGLLLGPFPSGRALWEPLAVTEAVSGGDWGVALSHALDMGTLLPVGVLAFLLIASGIELAVRRDMDLNRELCVAGVGNVVAGLGGGIVGFHALSFTVLAWQAGARSRSVGIIAAAVCGAALMLGADAVSLFPRPILGGLVVFLGLSFLLEWAYEAWFKLPRRDYLVVILILVAVVSLGFLPAVAVGLVLATALFVLDYSRTNVVRHELSGVTYQSRVDRGAPTRDLLRREGDRIYVLKLQGFVFFGTANALLDRIRTRVADPARRAPSFVVLDFRLVSGLDASAVLSFSKTLQLADSTGFTLVLTGLRDLLRERLERGGVTEGSGRRLRVFPDLDHGVQWCEDSLLGTETDPRAEASGELPVLLRDGLAGIDPEQLMRYLEPLEVEAGEWVIRQGEPSDDLYFLESGRLTAQLVALGGEGVRLRTMGPGSVVGEVTMYLGAVRTASVLADDRSRLYRLTERSLEEMERRDPELAVALHRFLARLLADRLTDALRSMDALM